MAFGVDRVTTVASPSCPSLLSPQHDTRPLLNRAQVWFSPAAMPIARQVGAAGTQELSSGPKGAYRRPVGAQAGSEKLHWWLASHHPGFPSRTHWPFSVQKKMGLEQLDTAPRAMA